MRSRIWILSELYFPEEAATGYYITRIAERLALTFSVHVLCAQPTYLSRGTKASKNEIRHRVHVRRCAGTALNKNNLFFRSVNLITISTSIFLRAVLSLRRGDVVLAVTNPPTLPFLAAVACWLRGARFVLKIEDLYPDALIATGISRVESRSIQILERMHKRLCDFSTSIIVLGRDTAETLERRYPAITGKVRIIPHWADITEIVPTPRLENVLLQELGLVKKFIVQYSGNMGRTHDVESVVEAATILRERSEIHFLFIGWGAKELWLREACLMRKLENVTILSPLPRSALVDSLNGSDVAVIPLVPAMYGVSVPSRMYNVLAAGKPLIVSADQNSELARVVEEDGVGWVVPPRSPQILASAIVEASQSGPMLTGMSLRARKVAEQKYSSSHALEKYVVLFRNLGVEESGDRTIF